MESLIGIILLASIINSEDPYLITSIVTVESNFNSNAVGSAGEIGLMQLKPKYFEPKMLPVATVPFFLRGIKLFEGSSKSPLYNPETNIRIGVNHIKWLRKNCGNGSDENVIICFNKGINGAKKSGFSKNDEYLKKVMVAYNKIKNTNKFGAYPKKAAVSSYHHEGR